MRFPMNLRWTACISPLENAKWPFSV